MKCKADIMIDNYKRIAELAEILPKSIYVDIEDIREENSKLILHDCY